MCWASYALLEGLFERLLIALSKAEGPEGVITSGTLTLVMPEKSVTQMMSHLLPDTMLNKRKAD